MTSATLQPANDVARGGGLVQTLEALTLVGAVEALVETGVAEALCARQPITTAHLASHCHMDPGRMEIVLRALEPAGVTAFDPADGTWAMIGSPEAWRGLTAGVPAVRAFLEGAVNGSARGREQVVTGERYRSIVEIFTAMATPITSPWVREHLAPGPRLLELGAGGAPWTRAYLDVDPTICATVVDLEPVLEQQLPDLLRSYPGARIEAVAGDVSTVDLGQSRFDLIVVAGFCRLFDAATNQRLFERVAGWVEPDGEVVVCDAIDTADTRLRGLANYALSLATRTSEGGVYGFDDFAGWMTKAGLSIPDLCPTPYSAMTILHSRGLA